MSNQSASLRQGYIFVALAYLLFVVYGSLVPLDFVARDNALQAFANIPYLDLGIESRADWVANILLYIPLTFLWAGVCARSHHANANLLTLIGVATAGVMLAVAVEFAQLYFPPRTVSQNDLIAETLGSLLGVALWYGWGGRVSTWLEALRHGGQTGLTAALAVYLSAYAAYSLFPFDFVVSATELSERLQSPALGWLLATPAGGSSIRLWLQLVLEIVAAMPLGIGVAQFMRQRTTGAMAMALGLGLLFGIAIETAQIFLNSGVSQGLSALTRAAGAGMGVWCFQRFFATGTGVLFVIPIGKRWVLGVVALLYLAMLLAVQGWALPVLTLEQGLARLPGVHFLPFYYHYYTTETEALSSLLRIVVAFFPVGVLYFMASGPRAYKVMLPAIGAAILALLIEVAKLFQVNLHPDPTNVLLAACAGAAGLLITAWLSTLFVVSPTTTLAKSNVPLATSVTGGAETSPIAMLAALIGLVAIPFYPLGALGLALAASLYVAILSRWPTLWLLVLPAALPVLDLTPWTGRFFFDEFDLLLLATLAVVAWRKATGPYHLRSTAYWLCLLLMLMVAQAMMRGMYPFAPLDANAFSHYYSPYNAVRVAKGFVWAMLLLPLFKHALNQNLVQAQRLFAWGMCLGVLGASLSVVWDRLAFTGLFNVVQDYRAVGLFSATHTGGAYLEAYLLAALPFVAWLMLQKIGGIVRVLLLGVMLLAGYALMVTYARAAYIALLVVCVLWGAGVLLIKKQVVSIARLSLGVLVLMLLAGMLAWFAQGSFMQGRLAQTGQAFSVRLAHWQDAVHMMDGNVLTQLFGMGLGRYPDSYFWRSNEGVHPATYRFVYDGKNPALSLGAGSNLYVEQIVGLQSAQQYQFSVVARSKQPQSVLSVSICEKWLLYSNNCMSKSIAIGDTQNQWRNFSLALDTVVLPTHPWYQRPTVKLSLYNAAANTMLELDSVSLRSAEGAEVLKNADFAAGMSRWFFAIDNDLPWHIENLWVQFYFEQGLIGLLLFVVLLLYLCKHLFSRMARQDLFALSIATGLLGMLIVGVVDSLFDSPRMTVLFFTLVVWVMLSARRRV